MDDEDNEDAEDAENADDSGNDETDKKEQVLGKKKGEERNDVGLVKEG